MSWRAANSARLGVLIAISYVFVVSLLLACSRHSDGESPSAVTGPSTTGMHEVIGGEYTHQGLPSSTSPDQDLTPTVFPSLDRNDFYLYLDEARPCPNGIGTFVALFTSAAYNSRRNQALGVIPAGGAWEDYVSHIEIHAKLLEEAFGGGPPSLPITGWLDTAQVYTRTEDIPPRS